MKEFTNRMLQRINEETQKVKGTSNYGKFYMMMECRTEKRWLFLGWAIPHTTGTIKTVKDKTYIITVNGNGETYRYTITEEVKNLLEM